MLCLVRERPAEHLPVTANDSSNDAGQLDKKVSKHIFQQRRHTCNHSPVFIGSRPSDHYFRSVCLSVCLFVCLFVCLCRVFLSRL